MGRSTVFSDRRQGIPFEDRRQGALVDDWWPSLQREDRRKGLPDRRLPRVNRDLQEVARGVHSEFGGWLDPRVVDECLSRVAATFDDARVRSFVPLLVRRYVRDELVRRHVRDELAEAPGAPGIAGACPP